MTETTPSPLNNVITIDDERIRNHLDRVLRGSVEETLNALLDAEADRLCNASVTNAVRPTRYRRRPLLAQPADQGWRGAAEGAEASPTAIIERYRRRESPVEGALIEMYLAGYRCADGQSVLNLAAARLRHIAGTAWSTKPCAPDAPAWHDGIIEPRI